MPHVHPRRPQAALLHAARLAFRRPSHNLDQILTAFGEALADHHHTRLPKGWDQGLLRAIFQGAIERSLGDSQRAATQVAQDLGMMRLFDVARPRLPQAA